MRRSANPSAIWLVVLAIASMGSTACTDHTETDGDGALDADGDADIDSDADTDSDADSDVDADADADADAATDADIDLADLIELRYDDGAPGAANSPWEDVPGGMLAVRFTPPHHPLRLRGARFFVAAGGVTDTVFGVRVFAADGADGMPGTDLMSGYAATAQATVGDEWVASHLTETDVVIEEGDFYVAMEWLTAAGSGGADAQFLGVDFTEPAGRSFWYWASPGEWQPIAATGAGPRDAMIRAYVE